MIFSRKTMFVAGAVLLAACGDKVTVHEVTPVTPVSVVNSVSVAPTSATLNIGQSITLTAAVNADAGLATTVTWAASASNVTVTAAGVVTAVTATPGVAVCATSTVDTGKKGCATIVVTSAPSQIPATVSIQSITKGGLNTPVDPSNVFGQMDVTLNVNPGNQTISKVVLLVGGVRADSQMFTAAQAAALRFSADEAVAAQTTFPQIVFSVNTAAFNATTGAPKYLNGAKGVSAQLYTVQGGTTTAATASAQTNLVFANVDGFAVTTSGGSSVVDSFGYRWNGNGSLTVTALPVMYSGSAVGTVNASLGANTGCAAVGAIGSATTATAGAYVITGTMAGLQSLAGCTTTSPNLIVINATNSTGDNLTLAVPANGFGGGVLGPQTGVRWDNVAPAAPLGSTFAGVSPNIRINVNPNGRSSGWINDAVVFNSSTKTTATSNGWLCSQAAVGTCTALDTLPRDAGVGGATYYVSVGATKAAAYAAAPITSAASLAASTTNAGYCAIAGSADALGNKTTMTSTQLGTACGTEANNTLFGVDRAAPQFGYATGSIAANSRRGAANIAGEMIVSFADTGLVGNSGMAAASPVIASMVLRNVTATGAATCIVGTYASSACGQSTTGVTTTLGTGSSTTGVTGTSVVGYYTFNATATDAAGNKSIVSPRTFVYDGTAPTVGAASTPVTVTATGFTASAFASEDLDIQSFSYQVNYATLPFAPTVIPQGAVTAVNGFDANPFINTNYVVNGTVTLPLAFQQDPSGATMYPLSSVQAIVTNQGNVSATGAIGGPTTVTPGTAISLTGFTTYGAPTLPATILGVSSGVTTAATATSPASTTITASAVGVTATFNLPFSRVDFYAQNAAATQWIFIGSVATPTLTDIGGNRTFAWGLPISGATLYTQLGLSATQNVAVMGVGVGVSNANIAMIPSATFALNIVK